MALFEQVSSDIVQAMKAKDKVRLEALRNIKKVFIEAKTAPNANDTLEDATALKLLQKLAKQGRDSASLYTQQNRADLAEAEMAQVNVIESYLPKALSTEEIEAAVKAIIAETGAQSIKEMGKVMGMASKQLAGQASGSAISEVVKRLLAESSLAHETLPEQARCPLSGCLAGRNIGRGIIRISIKTATRAARMGSSGCRFMPLFRVTWYAPQSVSQVQ